MIMNTNLEMSNILIFVRKIYDRIIVKLREREGQGVDPGRSLKGHLWMVDGGYPFPDDLH